MRRKPGKSTIVFLCILAVTILLNLVAWFSAAFCDWYLTYIFPIWVNTYGRLTGLFPFSVGEWLIVAGLCLVALAAVALLVWFGAFLLHTFRKRNGQKSKARIICGKYLRFFAWALLGVGLIMTLNCFILYHASTFSETYFGKEKEDYSAEELVKLYNRVATECNEMIEKVERDEEGTPVFKGDSMAKEAKRCMNKLGTSYSRLSGYYPDPKAMFFSDFMCQQKMQGYYFPFSMEANYNDVMGMLRKPATMCHELGHLRGYLYEDEANFIGYLACMQSDNPYFRYSGNASVLGYISSDLNKVRKANPEAFEAAVNKLGIVAVNPLFQTDYVFVTDEDWARINKDALIKTETVEKGADKFIDMNLKVNGISDGKVSYSRVVKLLLLYYEKEN